MGIPYTERLTEAITIPAAGIAPVSQAAGTVLTSAVDMGVFRKLRFIISTGVLGASATVDFKLQAATTSGGTYADVTGAAITQIVKASGDGKIATVELSTERLAAILGGAYRYVKGSLTVGTAASLVGVMVEGALCGHEPSSGKADASLVQSVVA